MAAITKIEFWKDVGFLEGAIEIPRLNAPDPVNPDLTIEPDQPIIPSKERFFSKLKVREYYDELMEMSYIRLTYELNDKTMIFYGWVRDISLESDGDLPMTIIDWQIDEWRTWKSAVTFGSGHVKRRPFRDLASTPIQGYQTIYRKLDPTFSIRTTENNKMSDNDSFFWVLVSINEQRAFGQQTITDISRYYFPCQGYATTWFKINDGTEKTVEGPSLNDIFSGGFDEYFGIDPKDINGVWLSYISPLNNSQVAAITGTGSPGDPLRFGTVFGKEFKTGKGMMSYIAPLQYTSREITFDPIVTTEKEQYVLVNSDGSKLMDLPYGMEFSSCKVQLFFEPDTPFIEITFKDDSLGNLEGVTVNVPLFSFPVNDNAYASYVYSGQRDYDREMRTVRSNANAWKTSATGAGSGAMMGAFGPAGLIAGTVGGAAGGLISYGVEMLYQNDEEQRLEDRLQANQPSSMILSSDSQLSIFRDYGISIRKIIPDDYSSEQIIATRNQFGISVDELMPSCDTLIRTVSPTGYYNIQNLIVNGNVPVSAKKWIREKFRSGVRLI